MINQKRDPPHTSCGGRGYPPLHLRPDLEPDHGFCGTMGTLVSPGPSMIPTSTMVLMTDMLAMSATCNPRTWKANKGGLWVQSQPEKHSKTLSFKVW